MEILTVKEIAEILRVHPTTIYNIIKRGDLPAIKVGNSYRVYKSDFVEYIKDHYDND
jgi:excisionase family DNA binding protein